MKRTPAILAALFALSMTGCTEAETSQIVTEETVNITEDVSAPTSESAETAEPLPEDTLEELGTLEDPSTLEDLGTLEEMGTLEGSIYEETAEQPTVIAPPTGEPCYYDGDYKGLDLNPTLRIPTSYGDIMAICTNPRGGGLDSFYLLQVKRAMTRSECEELNGWFERFDFLYGDTFEAGSEGSKYMYDYTLYEVIVLEDLISGEQLGHTAYVLTSMGIEYQDENDPPYSPDDCFTAALTLPQEGYDFRLSTGGDAFRYDVVGDTAYSRNNYMMDELLIEGSEDIKELRITTTTENPVLYIQKLPLDRLAEYLRADWESKGVSSHFE